MSLWGSDCRVLFDLMTSCALSVGTSSSYWDSSRRVTVEVSAVIMLLLLENVLCFTLKANFLFVERRGENDLFFLYSFFFVFVKRQIKQKDEGSGDLYIN